MSGMNRITLHLLTEASPSCFSDLYVFCSGWLGLCCSCFQKLRQGQEQGRFHGTYVGVGPYYTWQYPLPWPGWWRKLHSWETSTTRIKLVQSTSLDFQSFSLAFSLIFPLCLLVMCDFFYFADSSIGFMLPTLFYFNCFLNSHLTWSTLASCVVLNLHLT